MRLRQLFLRHAHLLVIWMMRPQHCLAIRDQFKQHGCRYRRVCERRLEVFFLVIRDICLASSGRCPSPGVCGFPAVWVVCEDVRCGVRLVAGGCLALVRGGGVFRAVGGGLRLGVALVDVRLDVVPLPPRSSSPTVAGCQLGGFPVGHDRWGGERVVGGVLPRIGIGDGVCVTVYV